MTGAIFNYIVAILMLRQPRGGGVDFRPTGAGRIPSIWAMSVFSAPKAMDVVCANIAELAISIAIPGESDLWGAPNIASGGTP